MIRKDGVHCVISNILVLDLRCIVLTNIIFAHNMQRSRNI